MAVLTYGNGPTRPLFYPDRARMALDWKSNRYLGGPSQLTRAGSALMLGPDGYQSFAAGELARIDGIGAQVAPARTNSFLRSQEFDHVAWSKGGGTTVASNVALGPDGTLTADRMTAGVATYSGMVHQGIAAVAGQTDAFTAIVKKDNHRYVGLRRNTSVIINSLEPVPFYDFDTDTVSNNGIAGASLSRVLLSNGWVALTLTFVATTTAGTSQIWLTNSLGQTEPAKVGTESILLWNAQLELNASYASPPIITSGAAVSRPGDILSASVPDGGRAFVFEFDMLEPAVGSSLRYLLNWNDGSTNNRYSFTLLTTGVPGLDVGNGGYLGGVAGPAVSLGRNTFFGVAAPNFIQLGRVGASDGASRINLAGAGPVNRLGIGGRGYTTADNTFIHAHRFTERPVTDFATPADAFAWAKSIAQGWA